MRVFSAVVLVALLAATAGAQTIPPVGREATLDVGTWNIRQFGDPAPSTPPDREQARSAVAVLSQSGVDVWAVQEITTRAAWQGLLGRLRAAGYAGVLGPEPTFGDFKVGFIYDSTAVTVLGARQPLPITGSFGGRQPFELHAEVTAGGRTQAVRLVAVHAKNGSGENDHSNRTQGALKLKAYADARAAEGEAVILLGDFNDYLARGRWRGATASPYAPFVDDAGYVAATLALEEAGTPTLCGPDPGCPGGLTIDHIVYTANVQAGLVEVGRYEDAIDAIPDFFAAASDHAPVVARLQLGGAATSRGGTPERVTLLAPAPNPSRGDVRVRFSLPAPATVRAEVFDARGRTVFVTTGAFAAGEHALPVRPLAPGAYHVRLRAGGAVRTATFGVAR